MKLWQITSESNNVLNGMIREFAGDPHPSDYHGCWLKCCMFASLAIGQKFGLKGQVVPAGVVIPGFSGVQVIHTELVAKTDTGEMTWDLTSINPKALCAGFYITNWTANLAIEAFINVRSNLPDLVTYPKGERYASASEVLDFPLDTVNFAD